MSCLTHLGFSSYKRKSIQSLYWDFGLLWVNRAYSEYITFLTKVSVVNAVILPVVMYRCESWTIKKVEHQRIDAFKLVLEKTLESPLDSKEIKTVRPKGNQLWIFSGRTDAEAETPILQPPDAKSWLIGKADSSFPDAGKDWRQKGRGWQRMRRSDGITGSMDTSLSKLQEKWRTGRPGVLQSWGLARAGHDLATEQRQNPEHCYCASEPTKCDHILSHSGKPSPLIILLLWSRNSESLFSSELFNVL